MKPWRLKNQDGLDIVIGAVYIGILLSGVTATTLLLFVGKIYAAVLVALICAGVYIRFKRGRVRRKPAGKPCAGSTISVNRGSASICKSIAAIRCQIFPNLLP